MYHINTQMTLEDVIDTILKYPEYDIRDKKGLAWCKINKLILNTYTNEPILFADNKAEDTQIVRVHLTQPSDYFIHIENGERKLIKKEDNQNILNYINSIDEFILPTYI